MRIDVLTLFPDMFTGVFGSSIMKRAQDKGLVRLQAVNFRDYADNKHMTVDDTPYGGGAGMVLKPEPIVRAVESLLESDSPTSGHEETEDAKILLMCPQGKPYSQEWARQLSSRSHLIIICGHYEGYDERIREYLQRHYDFEELSIGDYVLTGGEIPAMAVIDSVVRLIPGVLGNAGSAEEDSFANGRLEYPQYTRPVEFRGLKVPDVLLSGHHAHIAAWRKKEALRRTWLRRPDLLKKVPPDAEEKEWLKQFENEV